jgi:thiamine pyrophosphate-dependent acetolactate synthase large subunit-like protein
MSTVTAGRGDSTPLRSQADRQSVRKGRAPRAVGVRVGVSGDGGFDALLMLGTDLPYRPFYPERAPVVQVDVRGEHIGRRVAVSAECVG